MKIFALFIAVSLTVAAHSQNTINNYKYVLVPEKWDFFKTNDQYGLNSFAKMLLEDKGFTVYMTNAELPQPLAANKCNALKAELVEKKGFFVTNVTLLLKDCQGNVLFKSKEGKSREKEFQPAYSEALRDAFSSLTYTYDSTAAVQTQQTMVAPPASAPAPTVVTAPTTAPAPPPAVTEAAGTLYAQATANGYQLIDTTPKKVMTLLKTSLADYFIADDGTSNGIVFKKDGAWYFESYKDNKLVSQKLNIKF